MHRLNLLRPQEKTVCLFVFFSLRRGADRFFFFCGSALSHIQRKEWHCDIFSSGLVCYCLLWWRWGWREGGRRRRQKVFVCKVDHICWGFFFLRSDSNDATRRGHAMAIRKSVKQHWLCEANSQFALFSVSLYETPKLLLIYFPTISVSSVVPMCCCYSHRPLGVSVVTQEGGGGSLAIIWSRLRWSSSLSKVL